MSLVLHKTMIHRIEEFVAKYEDLKVQIRELEAFGLGRKEN